MCEPGDVIYMGECVLACCLLHNFENLDKKSFMYVTCVRRPS